MFLDTFFTTRTPQKLSIHIGATMLCCILMASPSLVMANEAQNHYDLGMSESEKGNFTKAYEYLKKAAELGYAEAQYQLGQLYESGKGVAKDTEEASAWYVKAAEQGYEDAKAKAKPTYEKTKESVKENAQKAGTWVKDTATKGYEKTRDYVKKLTSE